MSQFEDIEIAEIDEELSGRSDDGESFTIVANLSRFPSEEWRDMFPCHWQDVRTEWDDPRLKPCGDAELLWSSQAGCSIKIVSACGEGPVKRCIQMIVAAINRANDDYRALAQQRKKHRRQDRGFIAQLNRWMTEEFDW